MVARWILSRRVLRGEEKQTAIRLRDLAFLGVWQGGVRGDFLRGMKVYPLVHFFLSFWYFC